LSENQEAAPKPAHRSMTMKILIGIGAGIFTGLFFGDPAGRLDIVGKVYVGLLQMTVLPYVIVALISSIGRFSFSEGRDLARVSLRVLLLLFGVGLAAVAILPLSFPPLQTGAFFSTSILETRVPPDFMALYIPSNPFRAFSDNLVPAAVLFSILIGVALTGIERKNDLLRTLDVLMQALSRVNGFVVRLTPIGVFAIAATAAGTMTVGESGRLQAYLLTHTFGVLLLTFGVLPVLVSVLTPLRYRTILKASRDFLLTAWATGSLFVVLPMLIVAIEELVAEQEWESEQTNTNAGTLVALAYPFPTVGKLLALLFIPFVAWFLGRPLDPENYPLFLSAGLFSCFGNLVIAIPFMLQLMQLPSDFFNLFLMAGVWSARLGDLAGAMHILAFSLLTIAGLSGRIHFQARRAATLGIGLIIVVSTVTLSTRMFLERTFAGSFSEAATIESLHDENENFVPVMIDRPAPNPVPLRAGQSRLQRMLERGVMRVGYDPERLPFCFINDSEELVGFDMDMLYEVSVDLGLRVELLRFTEDDLLEQLEADHFDFAIGGLRDSLERAATMHSTEPYLIAHTAVIVRDRDRKKLDTLREFRGMGDDVTLAVVEGAYHGLSRFRMRLPEAKIAVLSSEAEFFEKSDADALLTSAEGGSAWTLIHPEYSVVLPVQPAPEFHYVLPVAGYDRVLSDYLNRWIDVSESDGTLDALFSYWIRGETKGDANRRWSIGRNVLGWWD